MEEIPFKRPNQYPSNIPRRSKERQASQHRARAWLCPAGRVAGERGASAAAADQDYLLPNVGGKQRRKTAHFERQQNKCEIAKSKFCEQQKV